MKRQNRYARKTTRSNPGAWLGVGVQRLLAILVSLGFLLFPVPGNAAESIAVARLTGTAVRNGVPLLNGSIVFSGDAVSTGNGSALQLSSSPGQKLWLGANTRATLARNHGNLTIALDRGTVGFSGSSKVSVTIGGRDLALRGAGAAPVLAQLTYVNRQQAQLWLAKGSLEIEQDGHSVLLQAEPAGLVSSVGGEFSPATRSRAVLAPQMQGGTGGIKGQVVNSKLFIVPGANVTLTSSTGVTYTATSNEEGAFVFNNVPPGTYTLHVSAPGYAPYVETNFVVKSGGVTNAYIELTGRGKGPAAGAHNKALIIGVIAGAGAAAGIGLGVALSGGKKSVSPSTI